MQDAEARINDLAKTLGIEFPEERLAAIAENFAASLAEADAVRAEVTEMPEPSPFDAAWESNS